MEHLKVTILDEVGKNIKIRVNIIISSRTTGLMWLSAKCPIIWCRQSLFLLTHGMFADIKRSHKCIIRVEGGWRLYRGRTHRRFEFLRRNVSKLCADESWKRWMHAYELWPAHTRVDVLRGSALYANRYSCRIAVVVRVPYDW